MDLYHDGMQGGLGLRDGCWRGIENKETGRVLLSLTCALNDITFVVNCIAPY